jgi:hypothetical protein
VGPAAEKRRLTVAPGNAPSNWSQLRPGAHTSPRAVRRGAGGGKRRKQCSSARNGKRERRSMRARTRRLAPSTCCAVRGGAHGGGAAARQRRRVQRSAPQTCARPLARNAAHARSTRVRSAAPPRAPHGSVVHGLTRGDAAGGCLGAQSGFASGTSGWGGGNARAQLRQRTTHDGPPAVRTRCAARARTHRAWHERDDCRNDQPVTQRHAARATPTCRLLQQSHAGKRAVRARTRRGQASLRAHPFAKKTEAPPLQSATRCAPPPPSPARAAWRRRCASTTATGSALVPRRGVALALRL